MNLIQKLVQVYEKVDHVDKRGRNTIQNYNYVKASDLAHAVRNALKELNVYAEINFVTERSYLIERGVDKDGNAKTPMQGVDVRATVVFRDADSNETLTASGLGSGSDMGDKALYKAQTGSLKYVLRNAFLVPDDADPEGDETVEEKPQTKVVSQPKEVSKPKPAPKADVVKAEIPNAPAQTPQTGSNTSTVSTSDPSIPSAEELNVYRVKFGTLVTGLSSSGLAPRKGFPVQKQVLAYLLKFAGKEKTELITKELWDKFFVYCESIPAEDLVKYVNQVFEQEKTNEAS